MQVEAEGILLIGQHETLRKQPLAKFTALDELAEYELRLRDARIAKSELELPADLGTVQREALERAGYELSEGEGKVLHTTVSYLASLPVVARCQLPDTIGSTGMLSIRQFHQGILSQTKAGALEDAGLDPDEYDF